MENNLMGGVMPPVQNAGGDIYLSLKPDKKGVSYRYCDCD